MNSSRIKAALTLVIAVASVIATAGAAVAERKAADIREVVAQHLPEVRACYQRQLETHPKLNARLTVGFTVRSTGAVAEARVLPSSDEVPRQLAVCVLRQVSGWNFGPDADGEDTAVSYPFVFERR